MEVVVTVVVVTVLITVMMRPELFFRMLRGGGDRIRRGVVEPKSEVQSLAGPQDRPNDTKEHHHG